MNPESGCRCWSTNRRSFSQSGHTDKILLTNENLPYPVHDGEAAYVVDGAPALVEAQPAVALGERGHLLGQLLQELRARHAAAVQQELRLQSQQHAQVAGHGLEVLANGRMTSAPKRR